MYVYNNDSSMIPQALDFYKDNEDSEFEDKYANAQCDAQASKETTQAIIGLKK